MKKLLILTLLLPLFAKAQVIVSQPQNYLKYTITQDSILSNQIISNSDSSHTVPTTSWVKRNQNSGNEFYLTPGYGFLGTKYNGSLAQTFSLDSIIAVNKAFFNSVIGTQALSRINARVKYTDTAAMLSTYKLKSDSTANSGYVTHGFVNTNIPGVFNVKSYGALGNGIADDGGAIQATINACYDAGGGEVYFPNGKYLLNGALVTSGTNVGNPNSQLYIKNNKDVTIHFVGESAPNISYGFPGTPTGSVILYSDITGSGAFPSLLGTAGSPNFVNVYVENMEFMVKSNYATTGPTMSALNFSNVEDAQLTNVMCGIDTLFTAAAYPAAETFGIYLPKANQGTSQLYNIAIIGYKYGIINSEHVIGDQLSFLACDNAMVFSNAYHANNYGRILTSNCRNIITGAAGTIPENAPDSHLKIAQLDIQWEIGTATPSWTNLRYVISDSLDYIKGDIQYHMVKANEGVDNSAFNRIGGYWLNTDSINTNPAVLPLLHDNTTNQISIQTASTTLDGALSHTDWNAFNNKLSPTGDGSGLTNIVTSITGTANQVIASATTGTITLSLPQDINTTSSPTFVNGTFTGTIYGASGIADPTVGVNSGTSIAFNGASSTNSFGMGIAAIRDGAYDIYFQTGNANGGGYRFYKGLTELVTITNAGLLGIGYTADPTSGNILGVNGNSYFNGTGTFTGNLSAANLSGTNTGDQTDITGNAGTVTNGVYTTGSYSNPPWITGIPYSILSGTVPTWNQNTTGTAANLSGTPVLPNGITATTQSANDNSAKLSTTAYADAAAASAAAYSEGTWTPTAGVTLSVSNATYTKIGNMVFARFNISVATNTDGSAFQITGLPFTNSSGSTGTLNIGLSTAFIPSNGYVEVGTNTIIFTGTGGSAGTPITNAQMSSIVLYGQVIYNTTN